MKVQPDERSFSGFSSPNVTGIPDQLFDFWLPKLNGAELKVALYICRRTLGFKKRVDAIGMDQLSAVRGKLRQRTVSLYRSMSYGLFCPGTI